MLEGVMDDVVEPAAEDLQLPRVLAALAEPNRLATVQYVARSGESCCSEVMQEAGLAMTKSTFSHHLRILREAGVLTKRIQGTWPEHFDVAIRVQDANFGVSPGDGFIEEPYAYVGVSRPAAGDAFWNAPFGAAVPLAELPAAAAVTAFFAEGRTRSR